MSDPKLLKKIIERKKQEVLNKRALISEQELINSARRHSRPHSLEKAISKNAPMAIIAELKKASPSAGVIRKNYSPANLALAYESNGASAISVLTDEHYFRGSLNHIQQIRSRTFLPILRKDFIIDPLQILESRAFGADAVLLITAALDAMRLKEMIAATLDWQMEALVEVHSEKEVDIALDAGASLIGINNRNLDDFTIDLSVTERLVNLVPPDVILVAESGIHSSEDARRMIDAGVHALLIGTHFMEQKSPGKALSDLLEEMQECFS